MTHRPTTRIETQSDSIFVLTNPETIY